MTEDKEAQATEEKDEQASEEKGEQASEEKSEQASEEKSEQASEEEEVKQEMEQLEEEPPESLEDWPQGKAKYETFGGPEGEHGYHEGPEEKLGPSAVRHLEGGEVTVEGEKVENPEEYKGDPIPGGPTDPAAPNQPGERDLQEQDDDDSDDDSEDDGSDD
jgi:hypothetical protein